VNNSRSDWLGWVEKISFRCLLVSIVMLTICSGAVWIADNFIISLHAKFLGVNEANLDRFSYDAKLIHYQFLGFFKLGAGLLFLIPWLVLRCSRGRSANRLAKRVGL
tara:strand:+ start:179 stop:499 length:321 start_codon:yes stop_codon:yes gene_type:complete